MDLNLTPQVAGFRDAVRAWLRASIPPDWDERQLLGESMETGFDYLRAWQRKVYEGGWAGVSWPKEYGGRGASLMEQVIFTEEMARAGAGTAGGADAPLAVSIAKMYASDAYCEAGNKGSQVHGGMGFTWEYDIHLCYKRAKASEIAFGDANYHRERIARLVIDGCEGGAE